MPGTEKSAFRARWTGLSLPSDPSLPAIRRLFSSPGGDPEKRNQPDHNSRAGSGFKVPESYVSLSLLPIGENDLEAIHFLGGNGSWSFSPWPTSVPLLAGETGTRRMLQSGAAFRLVLASQMPAGSPDLLVDRVGLQVLARHTLKGGSRFKHLIYSGGGADSPISFAAFNRSAASFWPLIWKTVNDQYEVVSNTVYTAKTLRPGEQIVLLVTEYSSIDSLGTQPELIVALPRADLLLAGQKVSVAGDRALLLLHSGAPSRDSLEYFGEFEVLEKLQLETFSPLGTFLLPEGWTESFELWQALSHLNGSLGNLERAREVEKMIETSVDGQHLGPPEREIRKNLLALLSDLQ